MTATTDFIGNDKDEIEQRLETATKLKVVGVVKAKKDASATPLAAGVGYARALTNDLIDRAASSAIVTDQKANPDTNVLNGMTFSPSDVPPRCPTRAPTWLRWA